MPSEEIFQDFPLNEAQTQAVRFPGKHLLVLAGAGSGKTRTIIARAAHLLNEGANANRILCLTFTRRAASELKQRLETLIGPDGRSVHAGTFHHFALTVMRAKSDWFSMRDKTVIDQDDSHHLFKSVCSQFDSADQARPQPKVIATWYSYARNCQMTIDNYFDRFLQLDPDDREYAKTAIDHYKASKQRSGYLDFDDILIFFAQGLYKNDRIREWVKNRFEHILVDEMQDTNPLQWLILDALRDPAKLFCVGDDAQSIYAFRGADFRNVHSFTERVPKSKVIHLNLNYRSNQEILDLANWLLSKSPLEYQKKLVADRGEAQQQPVLANFYDEKQEGEWIADQILDRRQEGYSWKDHLVLTRAMYLTRSVEAAFISKKIPYRTQGGTTFLQAAHVKDVLSLIRVGVNYQDRLGWLRFLELWPGIGDRTATKITDKVAQGKKLSQALDVGRVSSNVINSIQVAVKKAQTENSIPKKLTEAAVNSLRELLSTRYKGDWEKRKDDLDLLVQIASRFRSTDSFLDTTTIDPIFTSRLSANQPEDCVTISTVHAAKGTEARTCFICRLEPGHYPYYRSLGSEDEIEEERRILYVAMTRAKDELFLTRSLQRVSRTVVQGPSASENYFLEDLPADLVEEETVFEDEEFELDWDEEIIE